MTPELQRTPDRILGCLFGGAVADSVDGEIGYPTQLTLWTVEGLIRAVCRGRHRGLCSPPSVVHFAMIRWLRTQGEISQRAVSWTDKYGPWDGWLFQRKALFRKTHAGRTLRASLRYGELGGIDEPINNSLGAAAIAHVAPCGLLPGEDPVQLAREIAALTHGHPAAQWAAAATANIVHLLACGSRFEHATAETMTRLSPNRDAEPVVRRLAEAIEAKPGSWPIAHPLAGAKFDTAPDALGLAVFAAAQGQSLKDTVAWVRGVDGVSRVAVSLAGQLVGVRDGLSEVPASLIAKLKTRAIIKALGADFVTLFDGADFWWKRYPGW